MKTKPKWKMNITLDPKQFRIEKTTRGAPCLIFENYKFRYGNKMKDEIRWRCTNKTCKATIKTNEKGITEKRTVHDHEPFVDRRAKKKSAPKTEDRSVGKQPTYLIQAAGGHFVECRQSGDSFTQTNMDILPSVVRQETNIGGVRYLRKDGSEVIVVNEAPTHFMDILRGIGQHTPRILFRSTNEGSLEAFCPHLYMTQFNSKKTSGHQ